MGESRRHAYRMGAQQMAWPIISSTVTTLMFHALAVLAGNCWPVHEVSADDSDCGITVIAVHGPDFHSSPRRNDRQENLGEGRSVSDCSDPTGVC